MELRRFSGHPNEIRVLVFAQIGCDKDSGLYASVGFIYQTDVARDLTDRGPVQLCKEDAWRRKAAAKRLDANACPAARHLLAKISVRLAIVRDGTYQGAPSNRCDM